MSFAATLLGGFDAVAQETETKSATRTVTPVNIKPEPKKISPGAPLSVRTLVLRPPAIPNVVSWTIESKKHRGYLIAVALSPDAKQVATGGLDGIVRIWDVSTLAEARSLRRTEVDGEPDAGRAEVVEDPASRLDVAERKRVGSGKEQQAAP